MTILLIEKNFKKKQREVLTEKFLAFSNVFALNSHLISHSARKVKLADLIEFDKHFGDDYEILLMSWKAIEYDLMVYTDHISPYPPTEMTKDYITEFRWGHVLVLISRWLESLEIFSTDWLNEIRMLANQEKLTKPFLGQSHTRKNRNKVLFYLRKDKDE